MSKNTLFHLFERRIVRPLVHGLKSRSTASGSGAQKAGDGPRDPRIDELERRVAELEALVREDLGLRYLGLDRDGPHTRAPR